MPDPFVAARITCISTAVKVEGEPCAKCYKPMGRSGRKLPICCDACGEYWHWGCAGIQLTPRGQSVARAAALAEPLRGRIAPNRVT